MTTELLLPFFVGCAIRAAFLLGFAWTLTVLMRRTSASTRHFLWACAIAAAALVPAMMMALPRWRLSSPAAFAPLASMVASSTSDVITSRPQDVSATGRPTSHPTLYSELGTPSNPYMTLKSYGVSYAAIAASVWAAGTAAVLLYMSVGFLIAWRLRRSATCFNAAFVDEAQALARGLEIGSPIIVVESARTVTPLVCGFWRPTIIMPRGSGLWPRQRLRIVVLHELAHVKRRDYLTQAVSQFVCAVYWFNPLAWIAARCLYAERERACDDFVLATGTKGSDYARHLVEIARAMQPGWLPTSAGPAMARRSQLEERLVAVLDSKIQRSSTLYARVAVVAALLFITIPVTAIQLSRSLVVRHQPTLTSGAQHSTFPATPLNGGSRVDAGNERDRMAYDSAATLVNGVVTSRLSQAKDFRWNGTLNQGETLEVRGVYGSISTIASTNGQIQVDARIHDPALARVNVGRHENRITICSVVSTPNGDDSECQPKHRTADARKFDGRVDFVVQVPAGVRFVGSMIHGDITVDSLRSEVNAATIDGNIALDLSLGHGAEFYGNTISGAIYSDFPIRDNAPPVPSGGHGSDPNRPRLVHATIGNGGPALVVTTIKGNIRLRRG